MKHRDTFWWALFFAISAIGAVLLLPTPIRSFCAASGLHAIVMAINVESVMLARGLIIYAFIWMLSLPACCIYAYRGNTVPTLIVMAVDICVSIGYLAYAISTVNSAPDAHWLEGCGIAFRVIYWIMGFCSNERSDNLCYKA